MFEAAARALAAFHRAGNPPRLLHLSEHKLEPLPLLPDAATTSPTHPTSYSRCPRASRHLTPAIPAAPIIETFCNDPWPVKHHFRSPLKQEAWRNITGRDCLPSHRRVVSARGCVCAGRRTPLPSRSPVLGTSLALPCCRPDGLRLPPCGACAPYPPT